MKNLAASTEKNHRAATIYRKAARLMERQSAVYTMANEYSCVAIGYVAGMFPGDCCQHPLAGRYASTFADGQGELQKLIGGDHEVRILLLCFMAAMVERP